METSTSPSRSSRSKRSLGMFGGSEAWSPPRVGVGMQSYSFSTEHGPPLSEPPRKKGWFSHLAFCSHRGLLLPSRSKFW